MEEKKRTGFLGGLAAVMNAGGRALVYVCETTSNAAGNVASVAKQASNAPLKAAGLLTRTEAKKLEQKIQDYEKKIKLRYYEIGKESAHSQNLESTLQKESIQKLIADVRDYEKEVQQLKDQIAELKVEKKKPAPAAPKQAPEETATFAPVDPEQAERTLKAVVDKAIRKGSFQNASAKAIFKKVAEDLLDHDVEVRMLAAAELGKTGNPAAAPVLMAVARQGEPELAAEAINALIALGDPAALGLFKEMAGHPKYRVRMGCLRGIYKMAEDEDAGQLLIAALRDEHAEVRRSAVSFLGWKDYPDAAPSLVQCLRDEDGNVRKGAVAALTNLKDLNSVLPLIKVLNDKNLDIREKGLDAIRTITGESVAFDVNAPDSVLDVAINSLVVWWQSRMSGKDVAAPEPVVETIAAPEPVVEPVAEPDVAPEPVVADPADVFAFPEPKWDEIPAAVEAAPAAFVAQKPSKEAIHEMNKADLIALCDKLGVECDPKLTKAEIRKLLITEE